MIAATFPHLARAIEHSRKASPSTRQMVAAAVARYLALCAIARVR